VSVCFAVLKTTYAYFHSHCLCVFLSLRMSACLLMRAMDGRKNLRQTDLKFSLLLIFLNAFYVCHALFISLVFIFFPCLFSIVLNYFITCQVYTRFNAIHVHNSVIVKYSYAIPTKRQKTCVCTVSLGHACVCL
jgi:hypothetical protein